MKKAVVALAVVIGVAANAAEKFALQPVAISGGKEIAAAPSGEIVTVTARGVGANKVEALKDAYRDAVERAVGLYVDAEQQVKNDEVLRDQVLTQSNAYIEKYDLLKEESANGQVQVRIVAYVKKMALTKRLTEVMPAQTVSVAETSQNLHAQAVTEGKMRSDALSIIRNELKDFDPIRQLTTVKLLSPKAKIETLGDSSGSVRLWYPVCLSVDGEKYRKEFLPRWQRILDQLKEGSAHAVAFKDDSSVSGAYEYCLKECPQQLWGYSKKGGVKSMTGTTCPVDSREDPIRSCGVALNEGYVGLRFMRSNLCGIDYMTGGLEDLASLMCIRRTRRDFELPKKGFYKAVCDNTDSMSSGIWDDESAQRRVILISDANSSFTSMSGKSYMLSDECMDEILQWQDGYVGAGKGFGRELKTVSYQMQVSDKDGNVIDTAPFSLPVRFVSNAMILRAARVGSKSKGIECACGWFISPLVGGCAKGYVKWIGLEVATDDVAKMASVTIELAE